MLIQLVLNSSLVKNNWFDVSMILYITCGTYKHLMWTVDNVKEYICFNLGFLICLLKCLICDTILILDKYSNKRDKWWALVELCDMDKWLINFYKTNILHLRQGSFTRKVRTVFTLKHFCETLFNLSFTLTTIFYRKNCCEKGCRTL
jgi:hypothetical protein